MSITCFFMFLFSGGSFFSTLRNKPSHFLQEALRYDLDGRGSLVASNHGNWKDVFLETHVIIYIDLFFSCIYIELYIHTCTYHIYYTHIIAYLCHCVTLFLSRESLDSKWCWSRRWTAANTWDLSKPICSNSILEKLILTHITSVFHNIASIFLCHSAKKIEFCSNKISKSCANPLLIPKFEILKPIFAVNLETVLCGLVSLASCHLPRPQLQPVFCRSIRCTWHGVEEKVRQDCKDRFLRRYRKG